MTVEPNESTSVRLVHLYNSRCTLTIAPEIGGRIVSIRLHDTDDELLWHNPALALSSSPPGTAYDPHFFGGIDEILPCDMPEVIDGIAYPDHGELWTTPLSVEMDGTALVMQGSLPLSGLHYVRRMELSRDCAEIISQYHIHNPTDKPRHFLWKMHAAVSSQPGDIIICPAHSGQALDLAYSTCSSMQPFDWPVVDGRDKSVAVPADGTCEFLSLYDLTDGRVEWRSLQRGISFLYRFDHTVFPAVCLFQSFGGLNGHYTTVFGPETNIPVSVNDAIAGNQCFVLEPDSILNTTIQIICDVIPTQLDDAE